MNRIAQAFHASPKAFIAYLTAGDRSLDFTHQAALALIAAGVDLLEIGIPFSDPVADGPVIQQAMNSALQQSVTLADTLDMIKELRAVTATPIILFSYFNPILQAGDAIYRQAQQAGVDGILVVDLPFEESSHHLAQCQQHQLIPIQIIASSTPAARIKKITTQAAGFIYYACRNGTTGPQQTLPADLSQQLATLKSITKLPIAVGFGIASRSMAQQVLNQADAFVVGSYLVDAINRGASIKELTHLTQQIDPRRTT